MAHTKSRSTHAQHSVDYKDFTKGALARMLAEAHAAQKHDQLPLHKRKSLAVESEDDADKEHEAMESVDYEATEDREDRADLVEKTRPGNAPKVTPDDLPRSVVAKHSKSHRKNKKG